MLQPAPQRAVRGFFRVDLDVDSALFQILQLLRIQIGRSADRAAHAFRDGEVRKHRTPHAGHDAILQFGGDGVGLQPFEGSVHGKLRAREGCRYRAGASQIGPRSRVRRQRGEPRFVSLTALRRARDCEPSYA